MIVLLIIIVILFCWWIANSIRKHQEFQKRIWLAQLTPQQRAQLDADEAAILAREDARRARAFKASLVVLLIVVISITLVLLSHGPRSYSADQAAVENKEQQEHKVKEEHETVAAQLREKGLHIYTFDLLFDGHKRTKPLPLTCYTGGMILARSPEAAYKRLNEIASTNMGREQLIGGSNHLMEVTGLADVTELSEVEAANRWISSQGYIIDNDLFNIVPDPTPTQQLSKNDIPIVWNAEQYLGTAELRRQPLLDSFVDLGADGIAIIDLLEPIGLLGFIPPKKDKTVVIDVPLLPGYFPEKEINKK